LHRRVGEALEEMHRASPDDAYGVLARHFTEADEPAKAVDYLLKAGDAARALYADEEALEHYRKARDFLARMGDDRRARETLFKMALTHHLGFDFEAAERAYDEAFCCKVEELPEHTPTERLDTLVQAPGDLVPGDVYSTEGAFFTEHLFRGLLMVDRDLNVIPAMADNLRVSSDGKEYLFRLREGIRWSDGEPVTAEDFAFAWRSMREEQTRTAFLMEDVESAEALDDRTLAVRLTAPRSYFPYILASAWSFPWPRHKCKELGDDWRKPENLVSNGPFALTEYGEERAVLTANPHWVGSRGNVQEIVVSFATKGELEALERWREGRYDVLQVTTPVEESEDDAVADVIPSLGLEYVGFAADRPPFSNELVRKAFSHSLDRERFVGQRRTLARAASIGGAIPPAMPGHSHRVGPPFDLELARKLLADGGYPDGQGLPELTLVVPPWLDPTDLVEQWAALGARVVPREATIPVGFRDLDGAHLWFSGWTADYPDPDGFFRGLFRLAWPFHRDEDLDELLDRARFLTEPGERMRLYHEIDRLWVAERAAILPLAYPRVMLLRRPWVTGLSANPLSRALLDQVVLEREPAVVGALRADAELDH
ncbi:MAG: ABC transporter substrate-binding protein, partial [Actinobacteria bacterium]|nr:ABC transporter substrate-binding protein [Actinomycetota bacterium]